MDTLYTIRFETNLPPSPTHDEELYQRIDKHLSCYTLQTNIGAWRGTRSVSYTVEVIESHSAFQTILSLAHDLKAAYNQSAVLMTSQDVKAVLV